MAEKEIKSSGENVAVSSSRRNAEKTWRRLGERQKRHLELCVRLLACSQRMYLAEENWKCMDDPVSEITGSIEFDDNPESIHPESQWTDSNLEEDNGLPMSEVASSPFMNNILAPIWSAIVDLQATSHDSLSMSQGSTQSSSGNGSLPGPSHTFLVLQHMQNATKDIQPPGDMVPYLQLICACAEAFPFGECWSTCTYTNWHEFQSEDPVETDALLVKTSSPTDLAVVVFVVGRVLEYAGRPGGDSELQIWALRCLIQLAEASVCVDAVSQKSLGRLESTWQSIWHSLLHPTLHYVTFTKKTTPGTRGELTIALLGKMVSFGCPDLDRESRGAQWQFLASEHSALWKLPVFADASSVESPAIFDLIRSTLCRVGVGEENGARIDASLEDEMTTMQDGVGESAPAQSQRFKLLCFCLKRLGEEVATESRIPDNNMVSSLIVCCGAIVSGKKTIAEFPSIADWMESRIAGASDDLRVTNVLPSRNQTSDLRQAWFECEKKHLVTLDKIQEVTSRSRQTLASYVLTQCSERGGFVAPNQRKAMQRFAIKYMVSHFFPEQGEDSESESNDETTSRAQESLLCNVLVVRVCLYIALCDDKSGADSEVVKSVLAKAASLLLLCVKTFTSATTELANEQVLPCSLENLVHDILSVVPRDLAQEYLKPALLPLNDVCRDILEGFHSSRQHGSSNDRSEETSRDLLSDSDDDDELNNMDMKDHGRSVSGSKRRGSAVESPQKRSRANIVSTSLKSVTAATSMSSILLLLEPTEATCDFVYQKLSVFESGRNETHIDVEGARLTLTLICKYFPVLVRTRHVTHSMLSLFLTIVCDIRDGRHGGDESFMAGCSQLSFLLEAWPSSCTLESDDRYSELLLIADSKDLLLAKMRPHLLVNQLAAAIVAFERVGRAFRSTFESTFSDQFVRKAATSKFIQLRLKSAKSLEVALQFLPSQTGVYEKVISTLLCNKEAVEGHQPILLTICKAQKAREGWKSSTMSTRYTLLRLWGTIGGCAIDRSLYQARLFECIHFASFTQSDQPVYEYEPICQIALQIMCRLRGYGSSEALVSDESEYLWGKWLDSSNTPSSVPLNFSSNMLLSNMCRQGLRCTTQWGILASETEKIEALVQQATTEFVYTAVSSALPICLSRFSVEELEQLEKSNLSDVRKDLALFLESLHELSHEDKLPPIMEFVSEHLDSVLAHGILEAMTVANGKDTPKLVEFAFRAVAPETNDLLSRSLKQLLKLQSREQRESLDADGCRSILANLDFLKQANQTSVTVAIRKGAAELLLACRYWLDRAQIDALKESRWKSMEMIIRMVFDDDEASVLVKEFAIRTMADLLRQHRFQCCHSMILALILERFKSDMHGVVFRGSKDQMSIFRLISSLLHVHQCCQDRMLSHMCSIREREFAQQGHALGVLVERDNVARGGVWNWDDDGSEISTWLQRNDESIPKLDGDVARQTHDLLKHLLDSWGGTSKEDALENIASFRRLNPRSELLRCIDPKYSVQSLFDSVEESRLAGSKELEEQLSAAISRFESLTKGADLSQSLSIGFDSGLLLEQIKSLSVTLLRNKDTDIVKPTNEQYRFVRILLDIIASKTNNPVLRVEASKCIGCIGPAFVEALAKHDGMHLREDDWLVRGAATDDLKTFMVSTTLELLLGHAKSEEPLRALASLEACKAIASTKPGAEAINQMQEGTSKAFLKMFTGSKQKPRFITPSIPFVERIRSSNRKGDGETDSDNWCWAPKLWSVSNVSFDNWIKRLVSSIIICCYGKKRNDAANVVRGGTFSFRALARIAAMSPSVAAHLLPYIILDLLLTDDSPKSTTAMDSTSFVTAKESWIGNPRSLANQKVSSSFKMLNESLEESTDNECKSRVAYVLSTTLDLLRRISQERFVSYKKYPASLNYDPDAKQKKARRPRKERRFGSVLNLPPMDCVKIFKMARRMASAVYYGEAALIENGFGCSEANESLPKPKISDMNRRIQDNLAPLLRDCMVDLQEADAASAYLLRMTSMQFRNRDFFLSNFVLSESSPTEKLQLMSIGDSDTGKESLRLAECLQDLGSIQALKAYSDSVCRRQQLSDESKRALRETWFEASLTVKTWSNLSEFSHETLTDTGSGNGFFESLSGALNSLGNQDHSSFEEHLEACRADVLRQCSLKYGRESMLTSVVRAVEQFEVLGDLASLGKDQSSIESILNRWTKESSEECNNSLRSANYAKVDSKLATREVIIATLKRLPLCSPQLDQDLLTKHQWLSASIGMKQRKLQFAQGCLHRLKSTIAESGSRLPLVKLRLEEAKIMEYRGYSKPAIQYAQHVDMEIDTLKSLGTCKDEWIELQAEARLSCGIWTRKYKTESAKTVQVKYLMPAAGSCHQLWKGEKGEKSPHNARRLAAACLALAQNSAALFDNVHSQVKAWNEKKAILSAERAIWKEMEEKRSKLAKGETEPRADMVRRRRALQVITGYEKEQAGHEQELVPYAEVAFQSYAEALAVADNSSTENWTQHVMRMISIWFAIQKREPDFNDFVSKQIDCIPSYRFVPVTYQLFARVNSSDGSEFKFQVALQELVLAMCSEHPYHCLVPLFALVDADDDPKTQAAETVMAAFREAAEENLLNLFEAYEAVTGAYHDLAMAEIPAKHVKNRKKSLQIAIRDVVKDKRQSFQKILDMYECKPCVLTQLPPLLENHNYGGFRKNPPGGELLGEVDSKFTVAPDGISLPKIFKCRGTNGTSYKQLVKGNDDIRQDAIMQQVFGYTNDLLRRRTVSSSTFHGVREQNAMSMAPGQKLQLSTYSVVPLGPCSGIMEWVADSQSLMDFLWSAHSRYVENEWCIPMCVNQMREVQRKSDKTKRKCFDRICQNISPVFRYFFVEQFGHNAQALWTARMAYTRSCAVNSIVGHMLGIGDRHTKNILINTRSGELVHIDFGIVFEQGHILPVPETVPFRLTRDVVDGMGPLGTEGVFTAAAEETTRILRNNPDELLTILSAVVNDPVHDWEKGVAKARARQEDGEDVEGEEDRLRISVLEGDGTHAVTRVKQKLEGYEEGTSGEQQSIAGQVQLLINCARDHDNLSKIYQGWQPFL